MAQEILIIGIPNVVQWGEAGNKAVGIQKKFMYIHYVKRMQLICSKTRYYHAQRPFGTSEH
jgi:hypothetical protein